MDQAIIVFWDSIAHGIYGEEGFSWCDLLKARIQRNPWNMVYNMGIPWDTTIGVLARFECEIAHREHDIILFAIGINDTRFTEDESKSQTSINAFIENIQALIDISSKYSSKVAFVGMTRIDPEFEQVGPRFFSNTAIERYDQAMKEVLESIGIPYISVADCVLPCDLTDGLHPNQKGHEKMFWRIENELTKIGFLNDFS